MFNYETAMTGTSDVQKIWNLYSDVQKWSLWDKSVKDVKLFGDFCVGTEGVMIMADGSSLPILLTECTTNKSFTTQSKLGSVIVTFGHLLKDDENGITITHTVTIKGGDENQMKGMGEKITAGIPNCLRLLLSL